MTIRFGIAGIDTSHVVAFTQRLNHRDIAEEHWVDGGQIVAVIPFPSEHSPDRVPGFAQKLKDYGLTFYERPQEMIGNVDAVLVEENAGGVHLERAQPFLEAGLPVFVDKPLACSVAAARRILDLAQRHNAPLLSTSSLRYDTTVQQVQAQREDWGPVRGVDAYTPASQHPLNPVWFNYGVHGVEIVYALLGTGCRTVRCIRQEGVDFAVGEWADGRLGTVRGLRGGRTGIGFTAFSEKKIASLESSGACYPELLKQIIRMAETRQNPVPPDEMLEVVAFQEAANTSMERGGEPVSVKP